MGIVKRLVNIEKKSREEYVKHRAKLEIFTIGNTMLKQVKGTGLNWKTLC